MIPFRRPLQDNYWVIWATGMWTERRAIAQEIRSSLYKRWKNWRESS